jgi:hypothetical protein
MSDKADRNYNSLIKKADISAIVWLASLGAMGVLHVIGKPEIGGFLILPSVVALFTAYFFFRAASKENPKAENPGEVRKEFVVIAIVVTGLAIVVVNWLESI